MFDKQDEVIPTGNYLKYVIKDPNFVTDLCSLCDSPSKTIQHVTAWCPKLAKNTYTQTSPGRQNFLPGIGETASSIEDLYSPYDKHAPQDVLEKDNYKLY